MSHERVQKYIYLNVCTVIVPGIYNILFSKGLYWNCIDELLGNNRTLKQDMHRCDGFVIYKNDWEGATGCFAWSFTIYNLQCDEWHFLSGTVHGVCQGRFCKTRMSVCEATDD